MTPEEASKCLRQLLRGFDNEYEGTAHWRWQHDLYEQAIVMAETAMKEQGGDRHKA